MTDLDAAAGARTVGLVHWGQTGAGPLFLTELAEACTAAGDQVHLSYNENADIVERLDAVPATGRTRVRTYSSKLGVAARLPRSVAHAWRLRRHVVRGGVRTVVATMESIHQSLLVPFVLPRDVTYVPIIHDGQLHRGEAGLVYRLMRRVELARADAVMTLSAASGEALAHRHDQVVVGRHPAFTPEDVVVAPRSTAPALDELRVGFVGRLTQYKGLELLPEIARLLGDAGAHGGIDVHGDGPLRGAVQSAGPGVNAHCGWIAADELAATVARLDVVLIPYTEASQSGVVALAMSLGVPCVASPVGGLAEQVDDAGCGVVAQAPTAGALADAILRLVREPGLYARCSRDALASADAQFSWSRLRGDLLEAADAVEPRVRRGGRG